MKSNTRKPTVAQAEAAIRREAFDTFKDPESLKIRNVAVHDFYYAYTNPSSSYSNAWGYRITASINAKSGAGAYTGYQTIPYIGSSGRVIQTSSSNPYYPGRRTLNHTLYSRAALPAGPTTPQ